MNNDMKGLVLQLSKDKDLSIAVVKKVVEESVVSASKKTLSRFKDARCELDVETGALSIYVKKKVIEEVSNPRTEIDLKKARKIKKRVKIGEEVEEVIPPEDFGRIAAQSVRQGIMQRLRDAEREKVYADFQDRIGNLITGVVQRFERRDVVLSVGKVEIILPYNEHPYGARYNFGDRLRALIIEVNPESKGPIVKVSRTRPEFIVKLFEQEVPEISEKIVQIKSIAREAGVRTKIAVDSNNPDVDPVGACVGMKGSRVQMIVRELEREKIDIVPYSADPREFIISALNPAKVLRVNLIENEMHAFVVVNQESLSIAIGKRGQNAELASKLTGWKIDIISQEDVAKEKEKEEIQEKYLVDFLSQIDGLSVIGREAIEKSSYNTVAKIAKTAPGLLLPFTNDSIDLAEILVEGAKEYIDALREMEATIQSGTAPGEPEEVENEGNEDSAKDEPEGDSQDESASSGEVPENKETSEETLENGE